MARFTQTVVSASALAANTTFANADAAASANFKVRRCILGCIAGASVPTSQQVSVGVFRATARGTQTTTTAFAALDPRSAAANSTLDSVWSTPPTLGANPLARLTFNTQSGMDVPAELLEEWICDQGTANGIAFENLTNALPSGHSLTLTLEIEE